MQIKTFRAKSIQQALAQVRESLGPDASVLHTRRVSGGLLRRLVWGEEIEVAATAEHSTLAEANHGFDHRLRYRSELAAEPVGLSLSELRTRSQQAEPAPTQPAPKQPAAAIEADPAPPTPPPPPTLLPSGLPFDEFAEPAGPDRAEPAPAADFFDAFTHLLEAEVEPEVAHAVIGDLRSRTPTDCPDQERAALRGLIADRLPIAGPIQTGGGRSPRVAALVGPTGVGKTTTIAKLAANFRLRDGLRVGLITVDTYRVAAVEQLRTYADIIDLPMEVVATPREMRTALDRLTDLDLVLMDTAGRSPRDAVKVQELKSILAEAAADEVHLVLSTTAGPKSLVTTAERFATVGVSSLLLTKLDEATGLGPVLSLTGATGLPISYLTNGQNVPDDIQVAAASSLAAGILGATP